MAQHKGLEAEDYMVYIYSVSCFVKSTFSLSACSCKLNGRFMYAGLESLPYRTCTHLNIGLQYVMETLLEMSVDNCDIDNTA